MRRVYLDHAAGMSLDKRVLEAILHMVGFLPVIKPLRYCLNLLNWFHEKLTEEISRLTNHIRKTDNGQHR